MKKVTYKKILLIIFIAILVFSISTVSFASLVQMQPSVTGPGTSQVKGIANIILGIIQVIAVAVAVIMLVVLAIKYISAAPSEKGEIKKSLTVYIVGALVLFAGAGLLNIIQLVAKDITKATARLSTPSSSTIKD